MLRALRQLRFPVDRSLPGSRLQSMKALLQQTGETRRGEVEQRVNSALLRWSDEGAKEKR